MGTGGLFDVVNDLFTGAFTGVETLFSGPLGGIIVFVLAFAIIAMVWRYVRSTMSSNR